jgi:(p)ppGpp synthase/HD superfamily hydrolase
MNSILSDRFEEALIYSNRLHSQQFRKASGIPYIAHLLSVAALVLEAGGDEDLAIAALLHDAVEDQGGVATLMDIRQRFGVRVADIVDSCSDSYTVPKPAWRTRKENYIAHLHESSPDARLVSLADKLHNARSILRDLLTINDLVWGKFKGGKQGTLWYYRALIKAFEQHESSYLLDEFKSVVNQIETISENQQNSRKHE